MAQYIDKFALVTEIEKHKAIWDGMDSDYCKGQRLAYSDILSFINTLEVKEVEEEPASKDLEKAAIEAFKQIVDSDKNNFLEIFKAGAKWQKEQLMKDAIDTELDDVCGFLTISIPYHNGIAGDKVKVIIIKSE